MTDKYQFTPEDALSAIGGELTGYEIQRLLVYYPSYEWAHRRCLIEDILENESPITIAKHKLQAKGVNSSSKQSLGGHTKWVTAKLRRFVRRIIYLRLRLDQNMTKRQANKVIVDDYAFTPPDSISKLESLQRTVRKDTQSHVLDSEH